MDDRGLVWNEFKCWAALEVRAGKTADRLVFNSWKHTVGARNLKPTFAPQIFGF